MPRRILPLLLAAVAWAHAPIAPAIRGPLRADGARVLDASGAAVQLRGAALPGLDAASAATLGVLRIRWNLNAVRIPVRGSEWEREGRPYLERVSAAVERARLADLVAVLAVDDSSEGLLPVLAGALREAPHIVFSVRSTGDWTAWKAAMDRSVAQVRAAGARQLVAVSAATFADMPEGMRVAGENVVYEARSSVAPASMRAFGTLPGRVPVYAGEWALRDCGSLPADARAVSDLVFQTLFNFDERGVSWTASVFEAGSLLQDTVDYEPSRFGSDWRCGEAGMGETLLTWTTGDPIGFGYLRREAVASAAGGPSTPIAPGQLLSLYIEQMGPSPDAFGALDSSGRLPSALGRTEVFFDGKRVPILFAGQYQINVQAPTSLRPGEYVEMRVLFRGVPSNRIRVPVVTAAPELFHDIFTKNAIALNENGTRNTEANPAIAGSIVVLFGTGTGATTPAGETGRPAGSPHPLLAGVAGLRVDGQEAEILFAGEVPGFIGLSQINARLPRLLRPGVAPVVLRVGDRESQATVVLAVR